MQNLREKFLEYGTLVAVFLTPVLYFGGGWYVPYTSSKVFFFYAVVEILFAVWSYSFLMDRSYRFSKDVVKFFSPVILFLLWMTLSGVLSLSPSMSFWSSIERGTGLITLYHLLAFSVVVASLVKKNKEEYVNKLLFWFLNGAFVVAVSVWLGDEGLNLAYEFLQKSKGGGLVGNSSLAAAYLLFAIFFALFLLFQEKIKRNLKIWVGFILVFILTSPLFLNLHGLFSVSGWFVSARAATIGITIGLMVSLLCYLVLSKVKNQRMIGIAGVILLGVVFLFGFMQLANPDSTVYKKFTESAGENRFVFWGIAKKGIAERPLLGWGPENYGIVYQKYFDTSLLTDSGSVEVWNDRAHNVFFETGVAGGVPAIVLYLVLLISIVYGAYRAYLLGYTTRIQAGILSGLVVAYVLQNLFVFDSMLSLLGFFMLMGIVIGLSNTPTVIEEKVFIKNKNLIVLSIMLVLFTALFYFAWQPVQKVRTFARVTSMSLNKRPEHYSDLLRGSRVGDSWEVGKIFQDVYLVYSENKEALRNDPKLLPFVQRDLKKMLEYLENVAKEEPVEYMLHLNLARLYNLYVYFKKDELGLAPRILSIEKEAQILSPSDPQIYWAMSQTYIYMNDLVGAEEALREAIGVAPNLSWSYRFLLNFAKDTKNQKLYNEVLLQAREYIPDFR